MKSWQCIVCGFIYDEAKGLPEDVSLQVPLGLTFLQIGNVQTVA